MFFSSIFLFFLISTIISKINQETYHQKIYLNKDNKDTIKEPDSYIYYDLSMSSQLESNKFYLVIKIKMEYTKIGKPELFISKTIEEPTKENYDWKSSKTGNEIVSIKPSNVSTNDKFYIGVYCKEECDFILQAYLGVLETPKEDIPKNKTKPYKPFVTLNYINKTSPTFIKYHINNNDTHDIINIGFIGEELKPFKVYISQNESPSVENSFKVSQDWIYGYNFKMSEGDEGYCRDCYIYVLLITEIKSDISILGYVEYTTSPFPLSSYFQYYDSINSNKTKCYKYTTSNTTDDTIIISIGLFSSGSAAIKIKGFIYVNTMKDSEFEDQDKIISEKIIILYNKELEKFKEDAEKEGSSNIDYLYFCIHSYESTSFTISATKASEIGDAQQFNSITLGRSIQSILLKNNVTSYKIIDYSMNGKININMETEESVQIYGYFSEEDTYITFNDEFLTVLINNKSLIGANEDWIGKKIIIEEDENICHKKKFNPEIEEDERSNCVLYIIIKCQSDKCLFKINTSQDKTQKILSPRISVFNSIPFGQTDYYTIRNTDKTIEQIVVVLISISGNADMIAKKIEDGKEIQIGNSTHELDEPDSIIIKTSEHNNTEFYIEIISKTYVTYSISYYLVLKKQSNPQIGEIAHHLTIGEIFFDKLDKNTYYRIYSYTIDNSNSKIIRIVNRNAYGYIGFYVYKNFSSITYDRDQGVINFDWESDYSSQLIIYEDKDELKSLIKKTIYIVAVRTTEHDINNFEDETYYISVSDKKNHLILNENVLHGQTLTLNYKYQFYWYQTNSAEDIAISIYTEISKVNIYISFTEFDAEKHPMEKVYYMEEDVSETFIKIPYKDISKYCNKEKCNIIILIKYIGDEELYGASYYIVGKVNNKKPSLIGSTGIYFDSIDLKEENYYIINYIDFKNFSNFQIYFTSENGGIKVYAKFSKDTNNFPNSTDYNYKNEEIDYDLVSLSIPKKDYDFYIGQFLLITVIGKIKYENELLIKYNIRFSDEPLKIEKNSYTYDEIDKNENKYYKVNINANDNNIHISLFNINGDTDIYVNYGSVLPTINDYHWKSIEPNHQFININKDDPIIIGLGKRNLDGLYTILVTSQRFSTYTLLVSTERNLIPLTDNVPGSCKCQNKGFCNFKYNLFQSEYDYKEFILNYFFDKTITNLTYVAISNFIYGSGNIFASFFLDYNMSDQDIIDKMPNLENHNYSNLDTNKRNFMKMELSKFTKFLNPDSWIYISVKCEEDSLVEINTASTFHNAEDIIMGRTNVFYFRAFNGDEKNLPIIYHYIYYNTTLKYEISNYEGEGEIFIYQQIFTEEEEEFISIKNITLKENQSVFGNVTNALYYQLLYFKVKASSNFGFNVRVNYVGEWEKINEFGVEQVYKIDYNGLHRYYIFEEKYTETYINIRVENPKNQIIVYAKYYLGKDVDNFEIPNEFNFDFIGKSNNLLPSVLLKIPNIKNNIEGQPVRILLNIEVEIDSYYEDEATIHLMVSPYINYYQRLETLPLTLYSSIGKLNAKDTTIFDINKLNKEDNVLLLELASCGGELSTMVNNEVTLFRNIESGIISNSKTSNGRQILTVKNANLTTYYLSVWISGSDCDKTIEECNEKYYLYYYTLNQDKYNEISKINYTVNTIFINETSIKVQVPFLTVNLLNENEKEMLGENFHIVISNEEKDYYQMESLCFLVQNKTIGTYKKQFLHEEKSFVINGLEKNKFYYINIFYISPKNGAYIIFKPAKFNMNPDKSYGLLIGFVFLLFVLILSITFYYYRKYHYTKTELDYRMAEIKSGFELKDKATLKEEE